MTPIDKITEVLANILSAEATKIYVRTMHPDRAMDMARAVLTALSSSGYIICQASDAETGTGSAATPSQSYGSAEAWQSMDTAPKDGTIIDLWHSRYGRLCDVWWDDAWVTAAEDNFFTHWRSILGPQGQRGNRQLEEAQADTATEDAR
jgi:hypothetical protein